MAPSKPNGPSGRRSPRSRRCARRRSRSSADIVDSPARRGGRRHDTGSRVVSARSIDAAGLDRDGRRAVDGRCGRTARESAPRSPPGRISSAPTPSTPISRPTASTALLHQRVEVEVLERLLAELGHRPLALLGAGELRDVLHEALEPDGALPARRSTTSRARLEEAQLARRPGARGHPARERAGRTPARPWPPRAPSRAPPCRPSRCGRSTAACRPATGRGPSGPAAPARRRPSRAVPSRSTSRHRPSAGRPRAPPRSPAAPPGPGGGR